MVTLALTGLLLFGGAAQDSVPRDSALEARVRELSATLRCPVCQNLSIQDSPSELSQDMKNLVRERLVAGDSPEEVRRFFVERYGSWVLLEPEARGFNLTVWLLPVLVLVGGGLLVGTAVRRWVQPGQALAVATGSAAELRSRRQAVRQSLEDLEGEYRSGGLAPADYQLLRQRDEAALTALSAALGQAKQRAEPREPAAAAAKAQGAQRRPPSGVLWGAGILAFGVVLVLVLRSAVQPRAPGGTMTGVELGGSAPAPADAPSRLSPEDSERLTRLEAVVARDSTNHAALLELSHLYLRQFDMDRSGRVSFKAVQLRPQAKESAEAYAHIGMVLWNEGQTDIAIQSLDRALTLHPDLPEALLYKGIILFAGLQDSTAAVQVLERFFAVAPPGSDTTMAHALLQAARGGNERPLIERP